jgi:hypothetical protein
MGLQIGFVMSIISICLLLNVFISGMWIYSFMENAKLYTESMDEDEYFNIDPVV